MKKQLFPKEFIGTTIEHYHFKIGRASNTIYLVLIFGLMALTGSLPFIRMDVTKNVRGQITFASLRQSLYTPRSGQVTFTNLEENRHFHKGDTILRYEDASIHNEIEQLENYRAELQGFLSDLAILCSGPVNSPQLKTTRYRLEFESFSSQKAKLELTLQNARKAFGRQKKLFEEQVIAEKEYEGDLLKLEQARAELHLFLKQSQTDWKQLSLTLRKEVDQTSQRLGQLSEELGSYILLSPIAGDYQNVSPLEPGQFVQGGMKIAEISPGDSLIAVCYVSPADIGLLRSGQPGTFRIDAYGYNEWGMLDGEILEISKDAYLTENSPPVFQVKCQLTQDYLQLKNGFRGPLKKGMTFNANFKVANRSLYQLLYDKADDWMNPKLSAGKFVNSQ